MGKDVHIKRLTKYWKKAKKEYFKYCDEHFSCMLCPFSIENTRFCVFDSLDKAIRKLNTKPNFAQVELPDIVVNEKRGEKKNG